MLYYPYKMMLSTYKSVTDTPCDCHLFVSKVTKIAWYVSVHFWLVLTIKTTRSLVAEIMGTKYLFIHTHIQHKISKKNSLQHSLIFYFQLKCITYYKTKSKHTQSKWPTWMHTQQLTVHPLSFIVLWSVVCYYFFAAHWPGSFLSENLKKIMCFSAQCIRWQRYRHRTRTDINICQYQDHLQVSKPYKVLKCWRKKGGGGGGNQLKPKVWGTAVSCVMIV